LKQNKINKEMSYYL